jgi:hypothetical protein
VAAAHVQIALAVKGGSAASKRDLNARLFAAVRQYSAYSRRICCVSG